MNARLIFCSLLVWCVPTLPSAVAQTDSQKKLDDLFGMGAARTSVHKRFTAAQRSRIAQDLLHAEDRAAKEAERQAKGDTTREIALRRTLEDRYRARVGKKYHLSEKEITIIIEEANKAALKRHR
jgi:hypothetical protein